MFAPPAVLLPGVANLLSISNYAKLGRMKVVILYRPKSEHSREVEEYVHDFVRTQPTTRRVESVDVDSREGIALAELYDITQYPAVLAISNDGSLLNSWLGKFPLMDELAYYTSQE